MKDAPSISLANTATCPFFKSENALKALEIHIRCEGLYGRANKIVFQKRTDKLQHAMNFCSGNHEACMLFQALMRKYDE